MMQPLVVMVFKLVAKQIELLCGPVDLDHQPRYQLKFNTTAALRSMHTPRSVESDKSGTSGTTDSPPDAPLPAPSEATPKPGQPSAGAERYLRRMRGTTLRGGPPRVAVTEILWSWLGAFLGISAVGLLGRFVLPGTDNLLMIGSFGASAVLVYGVPHSPLAQPRNLIGGHMLSALIGVLCYQALPPIPGLAEAVSVASAIALMHLTRTLHPPGGATALIAVIGSQELHALGYLFVLAPVGLGAALLLIVGLLINNLSARRRYPEFWL